MRRLRSITVLAALLATSAAAAPAPMPSWYEGTLFAGETGTLTLNLASGDSYTYEGTCDDYCGDLDFALYRWVPATTSHRGYWKFIIADRASDDTPAVTVTPPYYAQYRLDIIMSRCNDEPCHYDVGVY